MKMDSLLLLFAGILVVLYSVSTVLGQEGLELMLPCAPGETKPCGSNIGVCEQGVRKCVDGRWREECEGGIKPVTEICDNGLDDDCDGTLDECVKVSDGVGLFLIVGGIILFVVSIILAKIS